MLLCLTDLWQENTQIFDLIFENVILGDKYTIIDYEWSLDFPVPIEYIMFRSVFTFMYVKITIVLYRGIYFHS